MGFIPRYGFGYFILFKRGTNWCEIAEILLDTCVNTPSFLYPFLSLEFIIRLVDLARFRIRYGTGDL